jgi:hypothetical protein
MVTAPYLMASIGYVEMVMCENIPLRLIRKSYQVRRDLTLTVVVEGSANNTQSVNKADLCARHQTDLGLGAPAVSPSPMAVNMRGTAPTTTSFYILATSRSGSSTPPHARPFIRCRYTHPSRARAPCSAHRSQGFLSHQPSTPLLSPWLDVFTSRGRASTKVEGVISTPAP